MNCGPEVVPIEILQTGETGVIVDVSGDDKTVSRLAEMGIRCGCEFTIKRKDCPTLITVNGHDILLRCGQAAMILVSAGAASQLV
ncbi:FeoA family protein [Rubinisphaera margarita]|uniref:FeoA family protein n=1 Tax=Rubinisphaera margarita TaxID=2909586 RepID=UPI001EE86036|nr:FeoA family protein [Rubinisphaera margarita]MCG6154796.1 ferrous iron transport protein A [Rubinisphaera margarita]